jgi:hypothetical protein
VDLGSPASPVYDPTVREAVILLVLLTSCRQLLGFESPVVPAEDASPDACDLGGCQVECVQHDQCASEVCLEDGSCADPMMVAYVEREGGALLCSQAAPCGTVQAALATQRGIIKISGTITSVDVVSITRAVVIHAAPKAVLTRVTSGPIIDVDSPGDLTIFDLELSGAVSSIGSGVRLDGGGARLERVRLLGNEGPGVDARNLSTLVLRRSIVAGNLGGGLALENLVFEVSNTIIAQNGSATTNHGGVRAKPAGTATFQHNTIADNVIQLNTGSESGITCDVAFDAHSNIVANNDVDVGCTIRASLFTNGLPPGVGNLVGEPAFLSTENPGDAAYYRIGLTSRAIDNGIGALVIDIDGEARPQGAAPDMGADERSP